MKATDQPGTAFRADIEGLRALAVLAVLAFHAGWTVAGGGFVGVDVFYVISGFLITGILFREIAHTGTVSFRRFYARRARRLLPAASLVLVVVAAASYLILAPIDRARVAGDIAASALYVANIRFAAQATDYLAANDSPSPVLHYWSLGVEEQFYLLWPALLLLVGGLLLRRAVHRGSVRADGHQVRVTLALLLAVVGVASFAGSLWQTRTAAPWAFFGMPARAWEFALGGLVALAVPRLARLPAPLRSAAGCAGLVMVVFAVVRLSAATPYPGTAAVLPVVGTALLVASGAGGVVGPGRLLSLRPVRGVGRISYSWYLWHWPVVVLAAQAAGALSVPARTAWVLASWVPAYLAYRFVENPLRRASWVVHAPRPALLMGAVTSTVAVVAASALALAPMTSTYADVPDETTAVGAAAGPAPVPGPSGRLTPDPSKALDDLPVVYSDGCHLTVIVTSQRPCVFGDPHGSRNVVLFGDSRAAQWFPALVQIATVRHWRLESWTKSGCPAADVTLGLGSYKRPYTECDAWRSWVMDQLTGHDRPDLVVMSSGRYEPLDPTTGQDTSGATADRLWAAGLVDTLRRLTAAGVSTVVLRGTPVLTQDPLACLTRHPDDPASCSEPAALVLPPMSDDLGPAAGVPGVTGLDLSGAICFPDLCPVVRAHLTVYRDMHHLTATYVRALWPALDSMLAPLLAGIPARGG